ncbi:hypothetical protein ANRL4_00156 [Anaerolineae bacterium]|nr:hypothetical protein ANRL4_00156 [Anaerolineae bacterium]
MLLLIMFVVGCILIVRGKLELDQKRVIEGLRPRLVGFALISPVVTSPVIGFILAFLLPAEALESSMWIDFICIILAGAVASQLARSAPAHEITDREYPAHLKTAKPNRRRQRGCIYALVIIVIMGWGILNLTYPRIEVNAGVCVVTGRCVENPQSTTQPIQPTPTLTATPSIMFALRGGLVLQMGSKLMQISFPKKNSQTVEVYKEAMRPAWQLDARSTIKIASLSRDSSKTAISVYTGGGKPEICIWELDSFSANCTPGVGDIQQLTWAWDNSVIYYITLDSRTQFEIHRLELTSMKTESIGKFELGMVESWAALPDGGFIINSKLSGRVPQGIQDWTQITRILPDFESTRIITQNGVSDAIGNDAGLSLSPDGRRIAFCRNRRATVDSEKYTSIIIMNIDGTNPYDYGNNQDVCHSIIWSPDASYILSQGFNTYWIISLEGDRRWFQTDISVSIIDWVDN